MARQLVIELLGRAADFTRSLNDANRATASFGERIADAGKKMTVFATVPIVGFLGAATKAAIDDAAAQSKLAKTLENTVGASAKVVAQVEEQIGAFMKVSTFTDDELRPAYESLALATGNVEDSTKLMSIAMDIAAGKGIPLETATDAVAKAQAGQFTAVNRLIPGLLDLSDKTLTAEGATAKLAAMFGGQASAATDTVAGKAQNFKRDLGELTESIGTVLLPMVTKAVEFFAPLAERFTEMSSGSQTAIVALLGFVAVIGPITTLVTHLGKLKTALMAVHAQAATLMAVLGPVIAAIGTIQEVRRQLVSKDTGIAPGQKGLTGQDLFVNMLRKIGGAIPGFATGGTVPGPIGTPQLVIAHGGETITPAGAGGQGGSTTVVMKVMLDGRQIQESLLRLQRISGNLGIVGA